ncbi:MAG: hypothetical protein AB7T07_05065 [Steroidobacteraceae bacterium]
MNEFARAPLYARRGFGYAGIAAVIAMLLLWLAASPVIDHVPLYDELLHFLAAQGLRMDGHPAIAHGEYTRALLFTRLVASSLTHFGESMVAARIPALIAALLLVACVAAWVTRRAGLLAGVLVALLLCLVPATVELAVFARFYTVHALLICAIVIAFYEAAYPARPLVVRIALGIFAGALIPLAWHFQSTTLIAVGAGMCSVAALLISDHWLRVRAFVVRYPLQVVMGGGLLATIAFFLFIKLDLAARMGEVPLWAAWGANRPQFYVLDFAQSMPLLWPMFPVASIFALMTCRRLSLFCIVTVLAALAVHSIAAAKSVRYIYYALPFFCVVWACALAGVFKLLSDSLPHVKYAVPGLALLAMLVLAFSQEGQRLAKLVVRKMAPVEALSYAGEPDWSPVVPVLQMELAKADRVVTSNALKALFYLGRYDYELNASIVLETASGAEFGIDERTGGRALGTAESVHKLLDLPGTTLVVLEERKIGNPTGVSASALAVITAGCTTIALPSDSGIRAWRCRHPAD